MTGTIRLFTLIFAISSMLMHAQAQYVEDSLIAVKADSISQWLNGRKGWDAYTHEELWTLGPVYCSSLLGFPNAVLYNTPKQMIVYYATDEAQVNIRLFAGTNPDSLIFLGEYQMFNSDSMRGRFDKFHRDTLELDPALANIDFSQINGLWFSFYECSKICTGCGNYRSFTMIYDTSGQSVSTTRVRHSVPARSNALIRKQIGLHAQKTSIDAGITFDIRGRNIQGPAVKSGILLTKETR